MTNTALLTVHRKCFQTRVLLVRKKYCFFTLLPIELRLIDTLGFKMYSTKFSFQKRSRGESGKYWKNSDWRMRKKGSENIAVVWELKFSSTHVKNSKKLFHVEKSILFPKWYCSTLSMTGIFLFKSSFF
jgi:hypothetical protein